MKPDLYPHQRSVKSDVYKSISGGVKSVMVKCPTGFGKTVLAADIIHDALSKGVNVVFCVPTLTLIDQTLIEFTKFGLSCGVIQADHWETDYSKPVQIASIQTIASQFKRNNAAQMLNMKQYFKDKLVMVDEGHLQFAAQKQLNDLTNKPVIALSATPWSKGIGNWYETMINGADVAWLIDNGYLSKYRAFSHYVPDMKGVKVNASGDYSNKESGDKYDRKIIGDIVKTWEANAKGRQTILFAPRVVDAERFATEFCASGYTAVAVSGYMDNDDCRIEVDKFRNHETNIICSVAKLTTGFDVKDVGCIIDVQPTKSLMRHVQKLGRGLRVADGKDDVIILDNAGNLLRLGLPTDEFPDTMDMGESGSANDRKDAAEPLPVQCSSCQYMKPPKTHVCPNCGFAPEKVSSVEVEAGDLVEIKSAMAKRNRDMSWDEKALFMSELNRIALDKSYKSGWTFQKYRAYFDVLPFDRRLKNIAPAEVIRESTQSWITSQNIRYANRRTA